MTHVAVTVVGKDRPGLAAEMSDVVESCGGNWLESRMANLQGTAAGVVLVDCPQERVDDMAAQLASLQGVRVNASPVDDMSEEINDDEWQHLHVVGNDHPGIVARITRVLASHNISIAEMNTLTDHAPMGGGLLFEADALIQLPDDVNADDLRTSLEAIATEIQVDLDLGDVDED